VSCTDDKIADYLLTGDLPKRRPGNRSDVQCDPVPPPAATPVEGAAASAKAGAAAHERASGLRRQIMDAAMPQP